MSKSLSLIILLAFLLTACASPQATPTPVVAEPTAAAVPSPTVEPASPEPASAEDLAALQANTWQWVSFTNPVEQFEVENPASYTLTFNQDGTVNILADCNNAAGSYTTEAGSLTIEVGPMTMAACPPESRSDQFVTYLGSAVRYFFQDGNLYIDLLADGGTLELVPAAAEAAVDPLLTSGTWQWEQFTSPNEQLEVPEPGKYTAAFLGMDDMVVIYADCNTILGTYTVTGQTVQIDLGPTTLAACGPESLSDQFLAYLQQELIYTESDGRLILDLPADGGSLSFGVYDPNRVWSWDEAFAKVTDQAFCDAPGAVLLADTPHGRYLKAQGLASTADETPVTVEDPFQIGSNTKSFTTVLALLVQEDGTWSLDDPLSKWLPEQAAKIPNGDQITLRMLGQNHTGIPDYAEAIIGKALDGGRLSIEIGPMTMAACAPDSRSDQFVQYLSSAAHYYLADGSLYLELQADGGTLAFSPVETNQESGNTSLTANPWQWVSFTNPAEQFEVENPASYTLTFNEDGTLNILADCNNAAGSYTTDGGSLDQASLEQGYTPKELVDFALQLKEPSFAPGEGWEYSTTNFILLGMAIEKATGQPLGQLYQERIFDPLGMDHSYLLEGVPEAGSLIHGYYTLENGEMVDVTNWNGSQGWAGGGIVSTAEDMARYMAGLASGAIFNDPASLEQMLDFGDGTVASFNGYGLGVGRWSADPFGWGHAGQTPGFQSLFVIYPELDSRVVLLTNSGSCHVTYASAVLNASPDLYTQDLP